MNEATVLASVCLITYNHEAFIAKAIEGIIMQQTTFRFELVIGEDCGKDGTREICAQYAAQYPQLIKLLPSDKNRGAINNEIRVFHECAGKYIAFCEGDDYWTDPYKLQKQVDFLEANPDFSMCFSDVGIIDNVGMPAPDIYPPLNRQEFTIEDIVTTGYTFIPTATLIFRNILPDPLPAFYLHAVSGDIAIHLLIADKGKAKYLPEKTAMYRHHAGGVTKSEEHIRLGYYKEFLLYEQANAYFGKKYEAIFRKQLAHMARVMLVYEARDKHGLAKLKHYIQKMPYYLKYTERINLKELAYYHAVLFFPSLLKRFKKPAEVKP